MKNRGSGRNRVPVHLYLYLGGLIFFGAGAYIRNEVSVSTCGGLIHRELIFGGGLIFGG